MNSSLRTQIVLAIVAGMFATSTVWADFQDYNYKAWNQPNTSSNRTVMRSRSYRACPPAVVPAESAPTEVAQSPSTTRTYSYEPKQAEAQSTDSSVATNGAAPAVQRTTQSTRSYSYEPQMNSSSNYSASRRGSRSSHCSPTPRYLLPKTDPNKLNY